MKYIDIHTHGAFGVDFNHCTKEDILHLSEKLKARNIVAFMPTIATDTIENILNALNNIKEAIKYQSSGARILGVHLECLFLNSQKNGIHNSELLLEPNIENFKKYFLDYEDIIKIVTMAPELDNNSDLQKYLQTKNIISQAGHTNSDKLYMCNSITHIFNATPFIHHRNKSITLEGLTNDNVYTEIIADGIHTSYDMLKLFFRTKNKDKILLVSDSLPITNSNLEEIIFCSQKINKNGKNDTGTLAGSVQTLDTIVENLISKNIISKDEAQDMAYNNQLKYLGISEI